MNPVKCLLLSVRADVGGGPEHIHLLLRGLASHYQFFVAAPLGQTYSERFGEFAELHDLPFRRFSPSALLRLVALIRREKIAFIHSHGKGAGVYARLLGLITGRPVIHTFHGFHYRHLSLGKRWLYLGLERVLSALTDVLLNVSASEQDTCTEAGVLRSRLSFVIPNGVVVPRSWENPLLRPSREKLVLINVARHSHEKGVDGVLRVARELKKHCIDFELWLVGDGEQGPALRTQTVADGLSENVRFLGFRDDVPQLLRNADIFISASHGEGMPLTLLEAMAVGLPSVASDVVGNRDVVENGETGFLFSLEEPAMAAQFIAQLVKDSDLFVRCSHAAHARALENYSVEVMCDRIHAVYSGVTTNRNLRTN